MDLRLKICLKTGKTKLHSRKQAVLNVSDNSAKRFDGCISRVC